MKTSWLALGAIMVGLYLVLKSPAPPAKGTAAYKTAASSDYWASDPSIAGGAKAGTLPAGITVYATTPPGAAPVLSQDASYEHVNAPGIGNVWVSIANLLAQ